MIVQQLFMDAEVPKKIVDNFILLKLDVFFVKIDIFYSKNDILIKMPFFT